MLAGLMPANRVAVSGADERLQDSRGTRKGAAPASAWRSRWRQWRGWLLFLGKPLRRGIVIFVVLLVIEYLVVPELVGASKDLYLLGKVNAAWLATGVLLEGASLQQPYPPSPDPGCGRPRLRSAAVEDL